MEGAVYLADAWRFVQRSRVWMLVAAVIAALVAAVVVAFSPTMYRSSALLTVVSERPGAEFSPPMLSSEGYLKLLKSRPVTIETFRRAETSSPGVSPQTSRLTPNLLSSRRGEIGNASLLELLVESPDPEAASALANAWAAVYLELDLRQSRTAAMRSTYHRLLAEEQKARDRVQGARFRQEALEARLATTPPLLSLTSRLSDRELLGSGGQSAPTSIVSQEVNPFHLQLMTELANTETEVSALERQVKGLTDSRVALKAQLDVLSSTEVPGADAPPPAVLSAPIEGLALPEYGSVQLVSLAAPSKIPEPKRALAKVLLAALGGAILGLLIAALRDAVQALPAPPAQARDRSP